MKPTSSARLCSVWLCSARRCSARRCLVLFYSVLAILSALTLGCGSTRPIQRTLSGARRGLGALTTLVPAASTMVLVLEPSRLFEDPAGAAVLSALFPEERLERFRVRTGIDPRHLTELVLALHPEGRVVVARGPIDAGLAVMEAGARMAPLESSQDRPFVRRAGFLGARRVELAAPRPDVILWVDGPPVLSAEVLGASRRAEADRDHPFERAEVSEIEEELGPAPCRLFAPHPLGLPVDEGVGMLLARQRALGATVQPHGSRLRFDTVLRGEFPPNAEANFERFARSMAASELGGALGLREALSGLEITVADGRVSASVSLDASRFASGLRALLVAPLEELLESDPTPPLSVDHAGSDPAASAGRSAPSDSEATGDREPSEDDGTREGRSEPDGEADHHGSEDSAAQPRDAREGGLGASAERESALASPSRSSDVSG